MSADPRRLWSAALGSITLLLMLLALIAEPVQTAEEQETSSEISGEIRVALREVENITLIRIPEFDVQLQHDLDSTLVFTTSTDEFGRFSFSDLPSGSYQIKWDGTDFAPGSYDVHISVPITHPATGSTVSQIHLPPITITPTVPSHIIWGRVRFEDDGNPVFKDHHFGVTQTVAITLLSNISGDSGIAQLTNAWGEFLFLTDSTRVNAVRAQVRTQITETIRTHEPITAAASPTMPVLITIPARLPETPRFRVSQVNSGRGHRPDSRIAPGKATVVKVLFETDNDDLVPPNLFCDSPYWTVSDIESVTTYGESCEVALLEWLSPDKPGWHRIDFLMLGYDGVYARTSDVVQISLDNGSLPFLPSNVDLLTIKGGFNDYLHYDFNNFFEVQKKSRVLF